MDERDSRGQPIRQRRAVSWRALALIHVADRRLAERGVDGHLPDPFGPVDLQPASVRDAIVVVDRGRGRSLGQQAVIVGCLGRHPTDFICPPTPPRLPQWPGGG